MTKKIALPVIACLLAILMGGCSMFGSVGPVGETFVNGTTAGNIQNLGFAVRQDDELYYYYTGSDTYQTGDIVKTNPKTGENSLLFHNGGLYMNLYNGSLYYCREDGIYRAPMDTRKPQLVKKCHAMQLQLSDDRMYYIEDGTVKCASVNGEAMDFSPIEDAACLIVDNNALYYIDSKTGQIWQAAMDGSETKVKLNVSVKQFVILENYIYFIDSSDSQIKRVSADNPAPETVMPYECRSFNVNPFGLFYTREVDGQWVCCSSDFNGKNEQRIENSSAASMRYMFCLFDGGALIVREEDIIENAE